MKYLRLHGACYTKWHNYNAIWILVIPALHERNKKTSNALKSSLTIHTLKSVIHKVKTTVIYDWISFLSIKKEDYSYFYIKLN